MLKKILISIVVLVIAAAGVLAYRIGPSNIIGMIRYDQREEGKLKIGDRMPDVQLISLGGKERIRLSSLVGEKPLVLVFGSFT